MKESNLRILMFGALLLFIFQSPANAQSSQAFDKQKLDTYLNTLAEEDKMMGSIAIDSAGQQVYQKAVGFRSENKNSNEDTKYRIGSVTKTFTAAMIFQLIEEDKLSLSTKLAEFYPDIPKADSITIANMLRHQSGLYNFTNASDYPDWMTEERSHHQLLELFRGDESQFSPGTQTSYSNTNYVLLGYILEDVTSESYAGQLKKRIADPLNLQHTFYGDGIDSAQNEAVSFKYTQEKWEKLPETDMSIPGGAGAVVSTPGELTDFIRALFNGELVSQESLNKMKAIKKGLGMGLMKIPFHNTYAYGHSGNIDGFQSNVSYFPKKDIAFAFTGNGLSYSMNDILIGTWSIYFGRNFEIPDFDQTTITLSENQKQQFVGKFVSDELPMDIEVFIEDETLKAQATNQPAVPLTATDTTTVRFERAGLVMKFVSLQNDKYQQFTLEQSGGSFQFKRQ